MTRWNRFVLRFALAAFVALLLWAAASPFSARNMKRCLESAIGAPVHIGSSHSNLFSSQVQLKNVRIENPNDPEVLLLQADGAALTVDRSRYWHRELVIESGQVSNLRLGVPAANGASVASRSTPQVSRKQAQVGCEVASGATELERLRRKLLDQLSVPEFTPTTAAANLTQVAKDWRQSFGRTLNPYKQNIERLSAHLRELQAQLGEAGRNPLRDAVRAKTQQTTLQTWMIEWTQAQSELENLAADLQRAQNALAAAKDADAQTIRSRQTEMAVDGPTLSKILGFETEITRVKNLMDWIAWLQCAAPSIGEDLRPINNRGVDVRFVTANQPSFLIRSLGFDGAGDFFGQKLGYTGKLSNFTLQPKLLAEPCVIELVSQGTGPVRIRAEIDRRTNQKIDRFEVSCPALPIPRQNLGSGNDILLSAAPAMLKIDANIRICGDAIDGTMTLTTTEGPIHATSVAPRLGGKDLATAIDRALATLGDHTTEIRLSGKASAAKVAINSSLGDAICGTVTEFARARAKSAIDDNLAQLERHYQSELASLTTEFQNGMMQVTQLLESQRTRVAELQQLVPSADGLERIR